LTKYQVILRKESSIIEVGPGNINEVGPGNINAKKINETVNYIS